MARKIDRDDYVWMGDHHFNGNVNFTGQVTGVTAEVEDITGFIEEGNNVTITGSGTQSDPYVINSTGGGGGSVSWGQILGDIEDQTDLNNILTSKVDISSLATVATSGDYNDLINLPSIISYNFENGLRNDSGTIKLGSNLLSTDGLLTENTAILGGNVLNGELIGFQIGLTPTNEFTKIETTNSESSGYLYITSSAVNVGLEGSERTGIPSVGFSLETDGEETSSSVFYDTVSEVGIIYADDYSANFTSNSLITKKYVDDNVILRGNVLPSDLGLTNSTVAVASSTTDWATVLLSNTPSNNAIPRYSSTPNPGRLKVNNAIDSNDAVNLSQQTTALASKINSVQEGGVGTLITNVIQVTQSEYDNLTPQPGTFYAIVG